MSQNQEVQVETAPAIDLTSSAGLTEKTEDAKDNQKACQASQHDCAASQHESTQLPTQVNTSQAEISEADKTSQKETTQKETTGDARPVTTTESADVIDP